MAFGFALICGGGALVAVHGALGALQGPLRPRRTCAPQDGARTLVLLAGLATVAAGLIELTGDLCIPGER